MKMHGSTNKSPIKLSMQQKINNMMICLRMGKTNTAKTPPGDFKVSTPKIPLLSQQAVTSKRIPVPYTNLKLNPYLNCTSLCLTVAASMAYMIEKWVEEGKGTEKWRKILMIAERKDEFITGSRIPKLIYKRKNKM